MSKTDVRIDVRRLTNLLDEMIREYKEAANSHTSYLNERSQQEKVTMFELGRIEGMISKCHARSVYLLAIKEIINDKAQLKVHGLTEEE